MTFADLQKEWKTDRPVGAYVFYGEEAYLKRHALTMLRDKTVSGPSEAFNHFRFDEDSFSSGALWDALKAYPVMAEQKLIEIRGVSPDKLGDEAMEDLCAALREAKDCQTVVVLYTEAGEWDPGTDKLPSKRMKALAAVSTPVYFGAETPGRLIKWMQKHFTAAHVFASSELCELLLARLGTDMFLLSSEMEKLIAYVQRRGFGEDGLCRILPEDVEAVCVTNSEFNSFAFSDAILSGQVQKAFEVLEDMKARREKPEWILGSIISVACDLYLIKLLYDKGQTRSEIASRLRLHEYRVGLYLRRVSSCQTDALRSFVHACYEADRQIKTTMTDSYEVLDRLIVRCRSV